MYNMFITRQTWLFGYSESGLACRASGATQDVVGQTTPITITVGVSFIPSVTGVTGCIAYDMIHDMIHDTCLNPNPNPNAFFQDRASSVIRPRRRSSTLTISIASSSSSSPSWSSRCASTMRGAWRRHSSRTCYTLTTRPHDGPDFIHRLSSHSPPSHCSHAGVLTLRRPPRMNPSVGQSSSDGAPTTEKATVGPKNNLTVLTRRVPRRMPTAQHHRISPPGSRVMICLF